MKPNLCTTIGNLGHSVNQHCAKIAISLKGVSDGEPIEARAHIEHFITQMYHPKCPRSALEYSTPMEFQRKNLSELC